MADVKHGLASSYVNHRCRCTACTEAWAAYHLAQTRNMSAKREAGREIIHGTNSSYQNWGCRCDACTKAHSAAIRKWRA